VKHQEEGIPPKSQIRQKKKVKKGLGTNPSVACVHEGENAKKESELMLYWEGVTSSGMSSL